MNVSLTLSRACVTCSAWVFIRSLGYRISFFFFLKARAPPEISPLPLHDPLPLSVGGTDPQLPALALPRGVNVVIAWYENRRGRELRSELLVADAAHTRADALITVGVLAGVLFARQGWWWIDPVVAIAVALVIVLVAYRILVRTVPVLVDQ